LFSLPQGSVREWLESLELSEYTSLFHSEGYREGEEDMANLKELDIAQLKKMGITKKGANEIPQ
jgi:hypothetical protein